jgi:hypothetical protein
MTALPSPVEWTEKALEDWHRLPMAEARRVAKAVQRFADTGQGTVLPGDVLVWPGAGRFTPVPSRSGFR